MLLQEPKSFDNLIRVTNDINIKLQYNGFSPSYRWKGYFYYIKQPELIELINRMKGEN